VIDGAEEYRAEPGLVKNASSQTNIFPINSGRRSWLKSWRVHVKDRLQVAICETVEVDDDSDIFGRQRTNETDRIFVRWTLLRDLHALHGSSLAKIKLYYRIYSASLIVNICMFYLFINKYFIRYNTPNGCHTPSYNSVWTYTVFDLVSPNQSRFD